MTTKFVQQSAATGWESRQNIRVSTMTIDGDRSRVVFHVTTWCWRPGRLTVRDEQTVVRKKKNDTN